MAQTPHIFLSHSTNSTKKKKSKLTKKFHAKHLHIPNIFSIFVSINNLILITLTPIFTHNESLLQKRNCHRNGRNTKNLGILATPTSKKSLKIRLYTLHQTPPPSRSPLHLQNLLHRPSRPTLKQPSSNPQATKPKKTPTKPKHHERIAKKHSKS